MSEPLLLFAGAIALALGLGAVGAATQSDGLGCLDPSVPKASLVQQDSFDSYFNALKKGNRCAAEEEAFVEEEPLVVAEPEVTDGGDGGDGGGGGGNGGGGGGPSY